MLGEGALDSLIGSYTGSGLCAVAYAQDSHYVVAPYRDAVVGRFLLEKLD